MFLEILTVYLGSHYGHVENTRLRSSCVQHSNLVNGMCMAWNLHYLAKITPLP
jgi:hypothetical protein